MENLQDLEQHLNRIDQKLLATRLINDQKLVVLERGVADFLQNAEESIPSLLNKSREAILDSLMIHRNNLLCDSSLVKLKFTQSKFKLSEKIFSQRMNFTPDFSILNKLKYLHLLMKCVMNEMSDIELFDFKYLKTRVAYSQMISHNSILSLISLQNGDYLLRVHKTNQSSFKTAREIILKSMNAANYWFLQVKDLIYFLYTKQTYQTQIDVYDFDLNRVKSLELETNADAMQMENFLSNKYEIILDYGYKHCIYDLDLKFIDAIDSWCKSLKLINISREYLFYLETNETRCGKNLLISNRTNSNVFHRRIQLDFMKPNEWSFFTLVDYDSNLLIKSLNGKEIYFVELVNNSLFKVTHLMSLNRIDLEKYGFEGIFQAENLKFSSNYNCLILFKNDGKRFKHVFIL